MTRIAQGLAVLAIVVITGSFGQLAYGQYSPENAQPVQKQVAKTQEGQPSFDLPLIIGIVGGIMGVSAIVVYITVLRTRKESKHTTQA